MNDPELRQLADAAAQVLRPHIERSEALRRTIALLGKWLCEEAARIGKGVEAGYEHIAPPQGTGAGSPAIPVAAPPKAVAAVAIPEEAVPATAPAPPPLPRSSALLPLRLGGAVVHVPTSGTTEELGRARLAAATPRVQPPGAPTDFAPRADVDLALVEDRCRLKAASCRLFIDRRGAGAGTGAEFEALHRMNEMIARAKAMPNCFLWVFWRERTPPDDAALSRIADNYDALADAASLVHRIDDAGGGRSDDETDALYLLAEANSGLRAALADTWLLDGDRDQVDVHAWMKQETFSRRVYIARHMTADDPADPSNAGELRARIAGINQRLDERADRAKAIKSTLGQIRYHAGQIVKSGPDDTSAHWGKIADAVARLGDVGVRATDRRITEALGTEAAALCPAESPHARALSAVLARARAESADPEGAEDNPSSDGREWSKPVLEVRDLLRGKRMVVIGGEPNPSAVQRFVHAFELMDAEWVPLTEHGPSTPMRAPINRPDTAVVVVIVKLAGHLHIDDARGFANSAGKPCILLSGGYNPERVANAILDQASTRLKG